MPVAIVEDGADAAILSEVEILDGLHAFFAAGDGQHSLLFRPNLTELAKYGAGCLRIEAGSVSKYFPGFTYSMPRAGNG